MTAMRKKGGRCEVYCADDGDESFLSSFLSFLLSFDLY